MEITEILYIVLIVAIVILTVTIVWLANETIGLIKSLRKSADDAAVVTKEFKEKTLLVTEAMDRVGTVATSVIGMVEDAIETIKEKRDKLADGLALVASVSKYVKKGRQDSEGDDSEKSPTSTSSFAKATDDKKATVGEKVKSEKEPEENKESRIKNQGEEKDKDEVKTEEKESEEKSEKKAGKEPARVEKIAEKKPEKEEVKTEESDSGKEEDSEKGKVKSEKGEVEESVKEAEEVKGV